MNDAAEAADPTLPQTSRLGYPRRPRSRRHGHRVLHRLDEIHDLVNSRLDESVNKAEALEKEIENLKAEIREEKAK